MIIIRIKFDITTTHAILNDYHYYMNERAIKKIKRVITIKNEITSIINFFFIINLQ
jgi:hypothetical protein